ncbi:MAG: N-acyl homoserine lactonase family protein [Lentisphaeria bacterium]|nr:N-acyl homoserine lactonase family protein [Lentisphaeria bacterium]
MKLHCLQSGFIKSWRHLLVIGAAEGERVIVPIPFYLIEHPQGRVLFDTGQRVPARPPDQNGNYVVMMTPEERAVEQLRRAGFMPESVTHIILSHTHGDHVEGLPDLPDVRCYLQRKEAEMPAGQALIKANSRKQWVFPDGELDLFGDGMIRLLPTYGHSPGHQSLLLSFADGRKILLTADAAYTETALTQHPRNEEEQQRPYWQTIAHLRQLQAEGVVIITGHDPATWDDWQRQFP